MRKKLGEQIEELRLNEEKTLGEILKQLNQLLEMHQQGVSNIEKLKADIFEQLESQGDCTRKSVEMMRNSISQEAELLRKSSEESLKELQNLLNENAGALNASMLAGMEAQGDCTRKSVEMMRNSISQEAELLRKSSEESLKELQNLLNENAGALNASMLAGMEAQGDCTRKSVEMMRDNLSQEMEAQGDCTRKSVEMMRGTIDGNMGIIRDKLDHRISLEVEEYREQIRESDLQPPITAQFNGKKVVKYPCDPRYCTGCRTCVQICPVSAIKKSVDDEGFYRIEIDEELCTGCGKCIEVCHVNAPKQLLLRTPKQLLACISKDSEIREKSSSGGVFTELAKAFIWHRGIVFGAGMDEDLIVSHMDVKSEEEIAGLRGSRYVQSDLRDAFCKVKEYIAQNKKVLFSGMPCQIAALKRYIGYSQYLYTIDIVCHGMASPRFFEDYKRHLETLYGPIKSINFRDKTSGWENYSINAEFENGERFLKQRFQEPFTNGFLKEFINAEVCHRCQYAQGERAGDITLADFWGFQEKEGKISNDDKDISACMINSKKGMELYHMIEDKLVSEEREYELFKNCNRPLKSPSLKNSDRENFWQDYREHGFGYACENWLK